MNFKKIFIYRQESGYSDQLNSSEFGKPKF